MKVFAFNAQGSRVIIHVRAMEIYVATVEVLRKKESMMKLNFLLKLVEKTSFSPNYLLSKIFIPNYEFDALYAEISCSHPLIA